MLPEDAINWLRAVFAACDRALSFRLAKSPNTHEPALDQLFISTLQDVPCYHVLPSQTTVLIDTHFLGGRAMFYNWEVADIGMLITFRVQGEFRFTKVVLFQSKRLYPYEVNAADNLQLLYEVGFARLFEPDETYRARMRSFTFVDDSRYLAISAGHEQLGIIRQYERQRRLPVYYLLYHPFRVPWTATVPLISPPAVDGNVEVGTRVVTSETVMGCCEAIEKGKSPSLALIRAASSERGLPVGGWPLAEFVVDHALQCREGRVIDPQRAEDLERLFYGRSGPIGAAIAVTVDVNSDDRLPAMRGEDKELPSGGSEATKRIPPQEH